MNHTPFITSSKEGVMVQVMIRRNNQFIILGHICINGIDNVKSELDKYYESTGLLQRMYFEFFNPVTQTYNHYSASLTN